MAKNLGLEIIKKYHIRGVPSKDEMNVNYIDIPSKDATFMQDELEFYKPMVHDLLNIYPGKVILVSWEHKRISFIAKNLGVSDEVFEILYKWPVDRFDQVWTINFEKDGKISSVDNFSQNIMQGDSQQAPKRYMG